MRADQAGLSGAVEVLSDGKIVRVVPVPERRNLSALLVITLFHTTHPSTRSQGDREREGVADRLRTENREEKMS